MTLEDWLLPILHQLKPQRRRETPGADTRPEASVSCDLGRYISSQNRESESLGAESPERNEIGDRTFKKRILWLASASQNQ